jgi:hypothetical protein
MRRVGRGVAANKAGIMAGLEGFTALAGAATAGLDALKAHHERHEKAHATVTTTEVKEVSESHSEKITATATTTEVVIPPPVHHHDSMFSELDLEHLPHTRTVHLIEVVGGVERAFEVEIKIISKCLYHCVSQHN